MKVVLLAPTPPPAGGIAGWTKRMMKAKLKNNWQVTVVEEKHTSGRGVFEKKDKPNLFDEIKRSCRIWRELKNVLKDEDVKVVHSCIPATTGAMLREYICAYITKKQKRSFIIHFRCTIPNTVKTSTGRFVLKLICNKSDKIFVLNKQSFDFLDKVTCTSKVIIPNFVSEKELAQKHDIKDELATVLYVGGVTEGKGAPIILELAKANPNIQFRLVGNGADAFKQKYNTQGIDNIVFTGPKQSEEVKKELADADVFLFLSNYWGEGFSNALCEAMAAGLPCIVTDWAANADMIGNDGGIIVKANDVRGADEALKKLASKEKRKACSTANINKVKIEYIESIVLDKYVNEYEKLL